MPRRLVLVMAALSVIVMALSHGDQSPTLPPVVDTSPYGSTVEPTDPGGEPFPGDKPYSRPARKPGTEPPGEWGKGELTTEDMQDAIEACAYGEIKDCG